MSGMFPDVRLRRPRVQGWSRNLVQETRLHAHDLILPVFVHDEVVEQVAIAAMPGVFRHSIASAVKLAAEAYGLGIQAIALFPVTRAELKDDSGREALNPDNLVCRAIKAIKSAVPEIGIIADVALDPYTIHGHDGILLDGVVDNDATVEILCEQSVVLARAGADVVAPSDMMDGRVVAIRQALNGEGFENTLILSYAAKYASSFYGPFRSAVGSAGNLKTDKKNYQMNPANIKEAMREAVMDIDEGADWIMVKPGLPYLDVLQYLASSLEVPVFAYQVSGEYSMMRAAADNGWLDWHNSVVESLLCFKRAGATAILTYAALDAAILFSK